MPDKPNKDTRGTKPSESKQLERKPLQIYSGDAWKCSVCHAILGYTDAAKETLRVKYKDFYCFVKGGQVTILCRRCGNMNTVSATS